MIAMLGIGYDIIRKYYGIIIKNSSLMRKRYIFRLAFRCIIFLICLMMFTPLITVQGFYTYSLLILAIICWLRWEITVLRHPERFWEGSNVSLRCSKCKDKLCRKC